MSAQRIAVNGTTLHCVDAGEGPVVVLLHGFPETSWSWRHQIPFLVSAGYRVLAPDLRGYGASDKHGPFNLATTIADITGLLDHVGCERAHIVGHDWGGALAWALAATQPSRVDRLVIINSPHPAIYKRSLTRNFKQARRAWYVLWFQVPWLPERNLVRDNGAVLDRIFRAQSVDRSRFTAADIAPFREALLAPGAATAMLGWYRAAMKPGVRIGRVTVPTRVIWGLDDKSLVYAAQVPPLPRLVSDLSVVEVPGAGHFVHEESPERVNPAILEHLRGAPSATLTPSRVPPGRSPRNPRPTD